MSEGYRSAIYIDFLNVKAQLPNTVHVHGSKGFIDLQEVVRYAKSCSI